MKDPGLQPPLEPDSEPAELTDTVVRGAGLAGAGFVVTQALTLGFYIALARLASPQDFGDLAAGTLLVNIGLLFSESGMLAALIHRPDRVDEAASTATVATAFTGVGLTLLALAASPLVGLLFDSSRIGEVAAVTSGLLLLRSLGVVPEALLQRRFSFLRRLIIEPVSVVVFGIAAVIATSSGLGVWGLVIAYYASGVVDLVLAWVLLRWRPRLRQASIAMWRELMGFARWGVAVNALDQAEQQAPVVLLGRFAGAGPLGQFRYAVRMVSTATAVVVTAGSYVLFPALARISANRERFREACRRSLRSMAMIGFPLTLILVPLGVPAAVIGFGETWRDAGYAAMALSGVAAAGILISFVSETLKSDGRPDILTGVHTVVLVASVAFMAALLPFELVGVSAGLSLGFLVGAGYGFVKVGSRLEVPALSLLRETLPALFASLLMAALLTPVEFLVVDASSHGTAAGLGLLVLEFGLGIGIYLLALRLLGPGGFGELVSIAKRLLRRKPAAEPIAGEPA